MLLDKFKDPKDDYKCEAIMEFLFAIASKKLKLKHEHRLEFIESLTLKMLK